MGARAEAGHHLLPLFEVEFVGLLQREGEVAPEYVFHLVACISQEGKHAKAQAALTPQAFGYVSSTGSSDHKH